MPIARLKTRQLTAGERTDLEGLVMYGFGLERRKALIDAHVSAHVRPFRGA